MRQTTSESMLKPRPARIPETRDNTPGSFCTKQFNTCLARKTSQCRTRDGGWVVCKTHFLNGCRLGGGVLYRMLVTASSADLERGRSMDGSGGGRCRRVRLYSRADVESSMGLGGLGALSASCLLSDEENARALAAATRRVRAVWARIADIVDDEEMVVVGEKAPTPHFQEQLCSRVTATPRT